MSVCLFPCTSLYFQGLMKLKVSDQSLWEEWKCGLNMCVCVCVRAVCFKIWYCSLCFNEVISTYFPSSVIMKSLFCMLCRYLSVFIYVVPISVCVHLCCADIFLCSFMPTNSAFREENRLTKQVETKWVTLKWFEMSFVINLRLMCEQ
jgi:hypothetical protein